VSQDGRIAGTFLLTERSKLVFNGFHTYTSSQDISATSVQTPQILTSLSDKRRQTLTAGYRFSLTERSEIGFDLRNYFNVFSDPFLVDAAGTSLSAHLTRKLSAETALDFGATNTWNHFQVGREVTVPSPTVPGQFVVQTEQIYSNAQVWNVAS